MLVRYLANIPHILQVWSKLKDSFSNEWLSRYQATKPGAAGDVRGSNSRDMLMGLPEGDRGKAGISLGREHMEPWCWEVCRLAESALD